MTSFHSRHVEAGPTAMTFCPEPAINIANRPAITSTTPFPFSSDCKTGGRAPTLLGTTA